MPYAEDILRILEEAGESGLSLQKIARHVFNASNSLFCPIEEAEVRRHVRRFLCRNCRDEHSLIERTRRGFYRLNTENYECQQLFLPFREADTDTEQPAADTDRSLSLF